MPYCPKCGKEVEDGASFCPYCGLDLKEDGYTYRREPSRWNAGRILMLLFGSLFIIVSLGLLFGGGALVAMESAFRDTDDYLVSKPIEFTTDTYALVSPNVDVEIDIPSSWAIPSVSEWISVKVIAESTNASKPLFIGIATSQDLESYLDGVEYEEVTRIHWDYDPWREGAQDINYEYHGGDAPGGPPVNEDFWAASGYGTQSVEFTWTPSTGDYVLVGMNNDGSAEFDADVQFGIRLPVILRNIGYGLLAGGIVILLIGLFILNAARR